MRRIALFALILLLVCPAARALRADAIDVDALNEYIARVNAVIKDTGNMGYISWVAGDEGEPGDVYFAVSLPYDEVATGRYAGETLPTLEYADQDIIFILWLGADLEYPSLMVESTSFPRDDILPRVYVDGEEEDFDWECEVWDRSTSLYFYPDADQLARWAETDEVMVKLISGDRAAYVTITPEVYWPLYDLYSALTGSIRYANRDSDTYLDAVNLPALSVTRLQDMPENGAVARYTGAVPACTLSMTAPKGDLYYYIVLAQPDEPHEKLVAFMVHPGMTAQVSVPPGEYSVYCASGIEWYGEFGLFGTNTKYCAYGDPVEFPRTPKETPTCVLGIADDLPEIDPMDFPF